MSIKAITTVAITATLAFSSLVTGSIANAVESAPQTTASAAHAQTYTATTTTSASDDQTICMPSRNEAYKRGVSLIDPYIEVEGGRLVANIPDPVKNQIPSNVYKNLMASLEHTNTLISEGQLDVNAVDSRYGKVRDAGVNGISVHWWGVSLKMSNDVFNKMSKAVAAGGGAAFIAGLFLDETGIGLPAGISLDALGGIIMAGVAIMQPCNWNDRGVGLHYAWVGPSWCWPQ